MARCFSASRALTVGVPRLKYRLAPWVCSALGCIWICFCLCLHFFLFCGVSAVHLWSWLSYTAARSSPVWQCQRGSCHIIVRKNLKSGNIFYIYLRISYWKGMSVRLVGYKHRKILWWRRNTRRDHGCKDASWERESQVQLGPYISGHWHFFKNHFCSVHHHNGLEKVGPCIKCVVIPSPFTRLGCKHPQMKAES